MTTPLEDPQQVTAPRRERRTRVLTSPGPRFPRERRWMVAAASALAYLALAAWAFSAPSWPAAWGAALGLAAAAWHANAARWAFREGLAREDYRAAAQAFDAHARSCPCSTCRLLLDVYLDADAAYRRVRGWAP